MKFTLPFPKTAYLDVITEPFPRTKYSLPI